MLTLETSVETLPLSVTFTPSFRPIRVPFAIFSAVMGLLWLSTVPFTMGLVAQTQGLTYLSTLAGLVFFSHQVGSFAGAWLGGRIFDMYQSYTPMWWAAIVFGVLAALLHDVGRIPVEGREPPAAPHQ